MQNMPGLMRRFIGKTGAGLEKKKEAFLNCVPELLPEFALACRDVYLQSEDRI
jgi:hypothetical protein